MLEDNPLISIIVPVYKVEKYLDRCLESITNQTYENLEIILVDDGSPDRCSIICDEWGKKDSRIVVIHKKNGGLSSARNKGLSLANGRYVGFVDSDDWISPNMYSVLLDAIESEHADISTGNIIKVKERASLKEKNNNTYTVYSQDEYAKKYFRINSNEPVLYVVNKLFDINIAKKMIFPEGRIDEDVEGFFRALLVAKKIVYVDADIYYYWQNPEGISYRWFTRKQMDLLYVWEQVMKLCAENKEEWLYYAQLNYYRANMGLLIRLALNPRQEDKLYLSETKILLRNLKNHRTELINSPILLSRKIIVMMFCFNYKISRFIIRCFHKCLEK